jgi:hypothetical protein
MWWKFKGPKRRRLWSSVMVMVMVRFRIVSVDKLSLFRPNLEVRSPRVAMLIKVWQPRVEKDGSAPLCVFEGATELRRGWHARAWDSLR